MVTQVMMAANYEAKTVRQRVKGQFLVKILTQEFSQHRDLSTLRYWRFLLKWLTTALKEVSTEEHHMQTKRARACLRSAQLDKWQSLIPEKLLFSLPGHLHLFLATTLWHA